MCTVVPVGFFDDGDFAPGGAHQRPRGFFELDARCQLSYGRYGEYERAYLKILGGTGHDAEMRRMTGCGWVWVWRCDGLEVLRDMNNI